MSSVLRSKPSMSKRQARMFGKVGSLVNEGEQAQKQGVDRAHTILFWQSSLLMELVDV